MEQLRQCLLTMQCTDPFSQDITDNNNDLEGKDANSPGINESESGSGWEIGEAGAEVVEQPVDGKKEDDAKVLAKKISKLKAKGEAARLRVTEQRVNPEPGDKRKADVHTSPKKQ
jgi:hypothetical protein